MNRLLLASLAAAALSSACGSTNSSSSPPGTAQLSGSVGGKPFVFRSGLGHLEPNGNLDILFSDADVLCDSATQGKLHAGETLVQAYSLTGSVPGKFAPVAGADVKYASIGADCATGQPIQSHADKHARATSTEFTILSLTATLVEGKVTLTFEDGSSLAGDFSVPACENVPSETNTCF